MGLQSSKTLEAERLRLRGTIEQQIQARNLKRPTIQLDASTTYSQRASRFGSQYIWRRTEPGSLSLSASQPLLLGGRYQTAQREADLRVAQAIARVRTQELNVARQVVEAYASVERDEATADIRKLGVDVLLAQLEEMRARQAVRLVGLTEISQTEARVAAARAQEAAANARLVASYAALERLIGTRDLQHSDLPFTPFGVPGTLEEAIDLALRLNHDIKIARFNEEIARATAKSIEAEAGPRAYLQAGVTASSDAGFNGARNVEAEIGARVSIPLWNAGQGKSRIRAALAEANAARVEALDLEDQLRERVISGWSALNAARFNLAMAEEQVRAAQIAKDGTKLEQDIGQRSNIEVLNQQQEWLEAQVGLANARAEVTIITTSLLSVIGLDATGVITPDTEFDLDRLAFDPFAVRDGRPAVWERPFIGVFEILEPVDIATRRIAPKTAKTILGPEE